MHQIWNIKSITNHKISLYYSLMSHKKIRKVQHVIILSAHMSQELSKCAVSLPGIVVNLNNKESNNIYLSASISTLFIAAFLHGNLFCALNRDIYL